MKKWKPKANEAFFVVVLAILGEPSVMRYYWSGDRFDRLFYEIGNCFSTRKLAREKLKVILGILKGGSR